MINESSDYCDLYTKNLNAEYFQARVMSNGGYDRHFQRCMYIVISRDNRAMRHVMIATAATAAAPLIVIILIFDVISRRPLTYMSTNELCRQSDPMNWDGFALGGGVREPPCSLFPIDRSSMFYRRWGCTFQNLFSSDAKDQTPHSKRFKETQRNSNQTWTYKPFQTQIHSDL